MSSSLTDFVKIKTFVDGSLRHSVKRVLSAFSIINLNTWYGKKESKKR